jgi:hypothetical protein
MLMRDIVSGSVSALSLSASEAVAAATVALERELRAQHEQTNDALRRLDAVKDEADRWRVAAESSQKRATLAQQHEAEARQLVQQTAVDLGSQVHFLTSPILSCQFS